MFLSFLVPDPKGRNEAPYLGILQGGLVHKFVQLDGPLDGVDLGVDELAMAIYTPADESESFSLQILGNGSIQPLAPFNIIDVEYETTGTSMDYFIDLARMINAGGDAETTARNEMGQHVQNVMDTLFATPGERSLISASLIPKTQSDFFLKHDDATMH